MTTVADLQPGDRVELPFLSTAATFVARTDHPLYPGLQLVIWRMDNGRWSHDALDARQEVGEVVQDFPLSRKERLRKALLGGPP